MNPYLPPVHGSMRWIFRPDARSGVGYQTTTISGGDAGTRQTVERMIKLAQEGAAHPGIREASERAVRLAGVAPKDTMGEFNALFNYVRDNVRYVLDPRDVERIAHPAYNLFVSGQGDCFTKGTLVLRRNGHALVPIESLAPGDEVWGLDRWSRVTQVWDRGLRQTMRVRLNNGGVVRLTPEHKVWVARCRHYASAVAAHTTHSCPIVSREIQRITVEELRPMDVVLQPERVPFGAQEQDPRRAYIEGLYVADGFMHGSSFRISGRDGFPREQQKAEVRDMCAQLGIDTTWADRSITVLDREWAQRCSSMGSLPWEKRAPTLDLHEAAAREFLRGVLVDSGRSTRSAGREFTTSSYMLMVQVRVLLKALGVYCGSRFVADHGSTSAHPVWRLTIRQHPQVDSLGVIRDRAWRNTEPRACTRPRTKLLRVKEVAREDAHSGCFDIATDDHMVWLPEADWTTSQCDEMQTVLASMAGSIGHGAAFRTVKADPQRPDEYSHVYTLLGLRGPQGVQWIPADVTQQGVSLGWEPPAERVFAYRDWLAIPP